MTTIPDVTSRYYVAAAGELGALFDCCTPDAHVRDEGRDFHGAAEIRRWREALASHFTLSDQLIADLSI